MEDPAARCHPAPPCGAPPRTRGRTPRHDPSSALRVLARVPALGLRLWAGRGLGPPAPLGASGRTPWPRPLRVGCPIGQPTRRGLGQGVRPEAPRGAGGPRPRPAHSRRPSAGTRASTRRADEGSWRGVRPLVLGGAPQGGAGWQRAAGSSIVRAAGSSIVRRCRDGCCGASLGGCGAEAPRSNQELLFGGLARLLLTAVRAGGDALLRR